jgi:methyltransferase (TIGR00027 family)
MSEQAGTINDVSDTAVWVAHFRALESDRPDALFKDPYAKALVGDRGSRIARNMGGMSKYTGWTLSIRTWVIDQFLQGAVKNGVDAVLNLGAGLDARPYRLDLPSSLNWVEVDYPHMIRHKEKILSAETPRCRLERVALDLGDREKRRLLFTRLSSQSKKILVLTEGVIPYLTEGQVAELAEDLKAFNEFQLWIVDYFAPQMYRYFQSRKRMKQLRNAPFRFFPPDWLGFFKTHGWKAKDIRYLAEESLKLGRAIPGPWWFFLVRPFISKKNQQVFLKMTGYILLERSPERA